MSDSKLLLSVKDLVVKFRVRGRILTAIRGISLDIMEDECIAVVGESGSGKSVFTKTFAGMLDTNGFIESGDILFADDALADTVVPMNQKARRLMSRLENKLNQYSNLEHGAPVWNQLKELESEYAAKTSLSEEEEQKLDNEIQELVFQRTELFNLKQTMDTSREKEKIHETAQKISAMDEKIRQKQKDKANLIQQRKKAAENDTAWLNAWKERKKALEAEYQTLIGQAVTEAQKARNTRLAKEIWLSIGRYGSVKQNRCARQLLKELHSAMQRGADLENDQVLNTVFDPVTFRVRYLDETPEKLHGTCVINLAKIKDPTDWTKVRGKRIATVFQDPMTSLNPIITIGKQITSVILKHQQCSELEARKRALELMMKVGIPNAEKRFDDYPFQYSGGMRQRIVIAIALSCQPKILICDEPTTALDVTIQAQILKLLKDLQKEFNYTIVFITHDLGVVANMADRVAVMYAGQIVELGTVEEVFYDPRHPYTWALLSSLPQLAQKNTELYSITGTPPSLYNKIVGDPFAPRNPYCMKIDTLKEPPMFQITQTHYAKTWLEDPRSPRVQKPEIIENIHEKLMEAYHI